MHVVRLRLASDKPPDRISRVVTKELARYTQINATVFDLLGQRENDLTAALAWTLTRSPGLLAALWARLGMPGDAVEVEVSLEDTHVDHDGRTDLQLVSPHAHVIVEAKKGWLLPGEEQLVKYVSRFDRNKVNLLVSLSESSADYAKHKLKESVAGVRVVHLPWTAIREDLDGVSTGLRGSERTWLTELNAYLAGATAVRNPAEQWVYVVSLSDARPGGGPSFIEYVEEQDRYFHLRGNTWPKQPPVLMGFRWGGKVQRVSRVVGSEVVDSLLDRWPDYPPTDRATEPHAVYTLGPRIQLPEIRTTGVVMARRMWVLLDQLLTYPLLVDAEKASKLIAPAGPGV